MRPHCKPWAYGAREPQVGAPADELGRKQRVACGVLTFIARTASVRRQELVASGPFGCRSGCSRRWWRCRLRGGGRRGAVARGRDRERGLGGLGLGGLGLGRLRRRGGGGFPAPLTGVGGGGDPA